MPGRGRQHDSPVLLAVSHGTDSGAGRIAVARLVEEVRRADPSIVVRDGFVDVQEPSVGDLLDALADDETAVVVPLLLSGGFHVHVDLAKVVARVDWSRVVLADALGPDPRLASVLARRLREVGLDSADCVVLAAAGSSDPRAVQDCERMAELLGVEVGTRTSVGFLSAVLPTLDTAVAQVRASAPEKRVVVSTFLLAPGYFSGLVDRVHADHIARPLLEESADVPVEVVEVVLDRYRAAVQRLKSAP